MTPSAVDSNILIYALADHRDAVKSRSAQRLIDSLASMGSCVVSTQAIKEFANFCTKKLKPPMAADLLLEYLDDLSSFQVVVVDLELTKKAVIRHDNSQISFYDALIVEAALASGAEVLYSEDLQHGMKFGAMQVINPFL